MRIVHVTDCYLPRLGGIELHVRDLADRQRREGHEVSVVTTTPGEPAHGVVRVSAGARGWLLDLDPDVVHAHVSIVSPFALATARHASLAGVPTAVTVHSLWTHVGPLPEVARSLWGMRGWPVTWSAVSDTAARPVRELLGVPVHVVPNAVDLEAWRPLPPRSFQPPDVVPHVVSVMRLTGVKRALPLLEVVRRARRHTDFRVTVIGDGPKRPAMERFVWHHGLADRVHLAGTADRAVIREVLAGASVFVAPAHRESFGISALEARASGVPVLASARSGVGTFVEHAREGLLARDDRELTELLVQLLSDDDLRGRIAAHNRRVPPAFGWSEALARHERLYTVAGAGVGAGARRPESVLVG